MIKPGDKVNVKQEGNDDILYKGHVQEVPENGPVCVFVEELGKRYDCKSMLFNGLLHIHVQNAGYYVEICRISVEKDLLTKITLPKANTPSRTRIINRKPIPQRPMMRPAFNDSWSDEV